MKPLRDAVFVLFGATGDLASRKIVPALFNLHLDGELPDRFVFLGVGRSELNDQTLSERLHEAVVQYSRRPPDAVSWAAFAAQIRYLRADVQQSEGCRALVDAIEALAKTWRTAPDVIFYLAIPPDLFAPVSHQLAALGLSRERTRVRVVVEKPLGHDLGSFHRIDSALRTDFDEEQVFRIDHYLGKETVQNVLAIRFANPVFEPLWNRHYIDQVSITVAERKGIEGRADYYEQSGALRDMVQNHLMQLLCLTAMEPPVSYAPEALRGRKMDVMHALRPLWPEEVAQSAWRGQYRGGVLDGTPVPGYREEVGVADSNVETFAALRLFIDNWRWEGVPFLLRTGKRLAADRSEIIIRFHAVPHCFFPECIGLNAGPAQLVFELAPNPGMELRLFAKRPGYDLVLEPVTLRFDYEAFRRQAPAAYETLLRDLLLGDPTLFMRADQVEAAWRWLEPILTTWARTPPIDFPNYDAGSWGPEGAPS